MKQINMAVNIYDDWYYAIEAEYNIAKKSNLYDKDFDSYLKEFIGSIVVSELYYNYMDQYVEQHRNYINNKITY